MTPDKLPSHPVARVVGVLRRLWQANTMAEHGAVMGAHALRAAPVAALALWIGKVTSQHSAGLIAQGSKSQSRPLDDRPPMHHPSQPPAHTATPPLPRQSHLPAT